MALKSVLDIQVNDAQFNQYYQKFQQYQASLAQMPTAWQQAGASAQGTALTFEKMGALMLTQTEMLRRIAEHYSGVTLQTTKQETLWKRMTEHAKGFAGHIVTATRSILHWGTLTTAFTGLLGAGGLWGVHRLAAEGATASRTSMGLGLSLGQMQAFRTSFGQLLGDPMGFLSGLSEARADPGKRVVLNQLRQSGTDPGAVLDAIRQMAQRWSPQMFGPMLGAYHLGQLVLTVEDIRRLHDMTEQEYQLYRQRYAQNTEQMNLTKKQEANLRSLNQVFEQSSTIIRTRFWAAVSAMGEGIGKLSTQVTRLVTAFMRSEVIGTILTWINKKLEGFASSLEKVTDKDVAEWLRKWEERGERAVAWFDWFTGELGKIRHMGFLRYFMGGGGEEKAAPAGVPGGVPRVRWPGMTFPFSPFGAAPGWPDRNLPPDFWKTSPRIDPDTGGRVFHWSEILKPFIPQIPIPHIEWNPRSKPAPQGPPPPIIGPNTPTTPPDERWGSLAPGFMLASFRRGPTGRRDEPLYVRPATDLASGASASEWTNLLFAGLGGGGMHGLPRMWGAGLGILRGMGIGGAGGGQIGQSGGALFPGGATLEGFHRGVHISPEDAQRNSLSWAQFFQQKFGWDAATMAGVMGSARQESGFDPGALGPGGDEGTFQWATAARKRGLLEMAQRMGQPASSLGPQQAWFFHEMTETTWGRRLMAHLQGIQGSNLPAEEKARRAAEAFYQEFESMGAPLHEGPRAAYAQQWLQWFTHRGAQPQNNIKLPTPKRRTASIEIRNQTGGSAYVAASQLAV